MLVRSEVLPTVLVAAQPIYEESAGLMTSRSVEVLLTAFGNRGVRLCEACMVPRTVVDDGNLVLQSGPIALEEVIRLDDQARGQSQPARSAVWIEEHARGVAVRIVDLSNGRVLYAHNVDPNLAEAERTSQRYRLAAELERRARGDGLVQSFFDVTIVPQQHISWDITDQWGKDNGNLSGFTVSLFDPVAGLGANYHRRLPILDTLIGGKVIISIPTVLVSVFDQGGADFSVEPLVTGVGLLRVPVPIGGRANAGLVLSASTSGRYGVGITLMNPLR